NVSHLCPLGPARWVMCADHTQHVEFFRDKIRLPSGEETQLSRRRSLMRIGQVAVNFSHKNPAIRVTKPGGDRHKINSSHDALAREEMPRIVETNPFESRFFADRVERFA